MEEYEGNFFDWALALWVFAMSLVVFVPMMLVDYSICVDVRSMWEDICEPAREWLNI